MSEAVCWRVAPVNIGRNLRTAATDDEDDISFSVNFFPVGLNKIEIANQSDIIDQSSKIA